MKTLYFIVLLLLISSFAFAQEIENPLEAETFTELLDTIMNFLFWLAVVIAPLLLLYAGFTYITAAGNPEKVRTANRIILFTIIGFIIIIAAKGIIAFLGEQFLL